MVPGRTAASCHVPVLVKGVSKCGDEVERVVAAAVGGAEVAAEVAAGDRAGDGAGGGVDLDVGVGAADLGVGGAHEHRWRACRRDR